LTALGALATAASGSLSIALEGSMLIGAFAAAAVARATGSYALGMAAGALSGLLLSLLVGGAAIALKADVFVAGLAANILAPGLVSLVSQAAYGTKGVLPAGALRLGAAETLALLAASALLLALFLSRSVFGLRLRVAGEGDEVAAAAGVRAGAYRLAAHLIAGAASGFAGAALASGIGAFVPGMTSGRGWIALVAVFLGGRRPGRVALSCLLFGSLFALSNLAQGFSMQGGDPAAGTGGELLQALPYAATVIALAARKRRA
jgi:simple sugar transport system permease protein